MKLKVLSRGFDSRHTVDDLPLGLAGSVRARSPSSSVDGIVRSHWLKMLWTSLERVKQRKDGEITTVSRRGTRAGQQGEKEVVVEREYRRKDSHI